MSFENDRDRGKEIVLNALQAAAMLAVIVCWTPIACVLAVIGYWARPRPQSRDMPDGLEDLLGSK
jgi:hypothetical protein